MSDADIENAAEAYATGNHRVSFADTYEKAAFIAGARHVMKERDAELEALKRVEEAAKKVCLTYWDFDVSMKSQVKLLESQLADYRKFQEATAKIKEIK